MLYLQVCPKDIVDRVNLGLIPSSEPGWQVACAALKPKGGILHIHSNVSSKHSCDSEVSGSLGALNVKDDTKDNSRDKGSSLSTQTSTCLNMDSIDSCNPDNKPTSFLNMTISKVEHLEESAINNRCISDKYELKSDKASLSKEEMWLAWAKTAANRISAICSELRDDQWQCDVMHIEHVKSYAPHIDHLVLDLMCKPCPTNTCT